MRAQTHTTLHRGHRKRVPNQTHIHRSVVCKKGAADAAAGKSRRRNEAGNRSQFGNGRTIIVIRTTIPLQFLSFSLCRSLNPSSASSGRTMMILIQHRPHHGIIHHGSLNKLFATNRRQRWGCCRRRLWGGGGRILKHTSTWRRENGNHRQPKISRLRRLPLSSFSLWPLSCQSSKVTSSPRPPSLCFCYCWRWCRPNSGAFKSEEIKLFSRGNWEDFPKNLTA